MESKLTKCKLFFVVAAMFIVFSVSGCSGDGGLTGNSMYTPTNSQVGDSDELLVEIPGGLVEDSEKIQVYFFWGEGCPYCTLQKEFHGELEEMFPGKIQFMEFETYRNPANVEFMRKIASGYNMNPRGVPLTFIGDEYFGGFVRRPIGDQIITTIEDCLDYGCPSPLEKIN